MDGSPPFALAHRFQFMGETLEARPSGALWHAADLSLTVSDLHLGKAERVARRGGPLLPPYDTAETLSRLHDEVAATGARTVVCLGDSFDDLEAEAGLIDADADRLLALTAGRRWIWIAGNHDPGPLSLPGEHLTELRAGPLVFRHEALPGLEPDAGEISGHYHPKARLVAGGRLVSRPCFLVGGSRIILPAFGCYTGGLDARDPALTNLVPQGLALLAGRRVTPAPLEALKGTK